MLSYALMLLCAMAIGSHAESDVLYVTSEGKLYKGTTSADDGTTWVRKATVADDKVDWSAQHHIFFDIAGEQLLRLDKDGTMTSRNVNCDDDFDTELGQSGYWNNFVHLFFHPQGDLFGVTNDGKLYRGSPPVSPEDDWLTKATLIGDLDWDKYAFLLIAPNGKMYGVTPEGKLLYGNPPTEGVIWKQRADELPGTDNWVYKASRIFFDPNGIMFVVTKDGDLYKGSTSLAVSGSSWFDKATKVSTGGWNNFENILFNPVKE